MQNNNIMPSFMIVFSDNTCKMIPFFATTKSTFYRKVKEIIEEIDFKEVTAVFYCGECYMYASEQFSEINDDKYIANNIKNIKPTDASNETNFDWLYPIKEKLKQT